jgi:DNA repair exonuclease SbcCD ATPase subunit
MIFFRNVKWKNLLSTGNYFTEIKLDSTSNTLIVGNNGSGKSTMLDALCFALFGKAFRNINKPNLVNSINNKDTVVEVEFDTNGKSYKIVRGIKPNIFEIYQDSVLLNQDASVRDYQDYLEKFILKLNYKSFTQIVILGSASFTPFMQLSAADRRAIIEDLLDIQIFSSMNTVVKDKLSNNKDLISNTKHNIDVNQKIYEVKKQHDDEMKEDRTIRIKEYDAEISNNSQILQTLHADITELSQKISGLIDSTVSQTEIESKIKKYTKLESQIESNVSKFLSNIDFFKSNGSCPTCRQEIALEFKESEIGSLNVKVADCQTGLSDLRNKMETEQGRLNVIKEVQKEIQKLQVEMATKNTTVKEVQKYIKRLQNEIKELQNTQDTQDSTELKQLEDNLKSLTEELKRLLDEKSYYEVASTLLKDSGIKTKIIKQYLPIINKLVNKYLASLDFFVNFTLDESFKEVIKSRHRDEFSYHNFSEGEKQRIDMALMLTWRAIAKLKNSANTNLLILDEVFDSSLDTSGTEELMKILHMLEDVNLFVISHKGDILHDKFINVIKFDKVKNFSRIVK